MPTWIKQIEVKNFRTFKHQIVDLRKLNIIIGANGSGKTNFIQILKFIKDLGTLGLDNAISMQGGIEYLQNITIGPRENLFLKVVFAMEYGVGIKKVEDGIVGIKIHEVAYELELKFDTNENIIIIEREQLVLKCDFVKLISKNKGEYDEKILFDNKRIVISRVRNKVMVDLEIPEGLDISVMDIYPQYLVPNEIKGNELILNMIYFLALDFTLKKAIDNITIYDIHPSLAKESTPITGKAELECDGRNISIILKRLIENPENRRKFTNLVQDILPYITGFKVDKYADKSMLFKMQETYYEDQYIPATFISDGTINLVALIIALYFEKKPIIVIEEPERNIHPSLIARIVAMMKDASSNKQIFVTTHNPEVLKQAEIEDVLLITRENDGFSSISRPADSEELKTFLEHEIGIDELFVQNLIR